MDSAITTSVKGATISKNQHGIRFIPVACGLNGFSRWNCHPSNGWRGLSRILAVPPMDNISRAERSATMARVKAKNSKPEMLVRSYLHRRGLRFRLHVKELPGKPDIVLPKYRTVVFVNGCFWHRHPDPNCKLARMPKSNTEYWECKLSGNRERDIQNYAKLKKLGWRVFNIWECQLLHPEKMLEQFLLELKISSPS